MTEFLACLIGIVIGVGSMIYVSWKTFEDVWDSSYKAGYRHGVEDERIRQANERLESRIFEKVKEVSVDDCP